MVKTALRFAPPAVAAVQLALILVGGPLPSAARAIGIGCVVASFVGAIAIRRPDVRAHATVALAVAAVAAAGQIRGGGRYALGSTIFVGFCVACLRLPRLADGGSGAPAPRRAAIVAGGLTIGVAVLLTWQLPRAAGWVETRVARWLGAVDADEATGFSSNMRLGSTHGMLRSERIVMRIEGEAPELLRGASYDRYDFGEWTSASDTSTRRLVTADAPEARATTRITFARSARVARGVEARFFLPAGACDLGSPSGKAWLDVTAVAHPEPADASLVWFRTGACTTPPASTAAPSKADLEVDHRIRTAVAKVAAEWTAGARTDRAKLDAITGRLSAFGYSLDVRRDARFDPIVDFLTIHREGHCELFASAMALLARSEGIPARVVSGYRGGDANTAFGYTVVRERNAHAWVEAYVDGAWRAFDPTPPIEGMRRTESRFDGAIDAAFYALERALAALGRVTLLQWGVVLGAAFVVLYAIREVGRFLGRRRGATTSVLGAAAPVLPAFDALATRLEAAGHARDASEPIEAFARRIEAVDAPWSDAVADALARYAALRYGDQGEEPQVVAALEAATRALVSASPARRAAAP